MLPVLLFTATQILVFQNAYAQDSADYATVKSRLVKTLKKREIDKNFTQCIDCFYQVTCDSLIREGLRVEDRPIQDILVKLFLACEEKLKTRTITSLRIPSVNNYFLQTLKIYGRQPLNKLYREIGITQTEILQSAFDGLLLGDSIRTYMGLREMLNFPYFIATRIGMPRYARYRDTLLYYLANAHPDILVDELSDRDSIITALVDKSRNLTVKSVSWIKDDYYFDLLMPFSLALYQKRVSEDELIKLSLDPPGFYHAFIEEALRLHKDPDPQVNAYLKQPILQANRNLANSYFITEINWLHNAPYKTRFQVISNLGAKDLYFIIIGGGNQLYTSSFLYVYKKLLEETEKEGLEHFLDETGYYQFDQFISNISGYGLVGNLVSHLREEKFAAIIEKYFDRLQSTQLTDNEIILNAMTLSEVVYEARKFPVVKAALLSRIDSIEKGNPDLLLQRMYAGLKDILMDKNDYKTDKAYDELAIDRLKRNNTIVQACFFYDDEDGCSSFASSMALFDAKTWAKEDRGNYIVFRSRYGNDVRVYMNKPNSSVGFDASQDEMLRAIKDEGYEATCFIHRGHSYHLPTSIGKMTSAARFVFLGSCGGYNDVLKIFQLNPDVNVIVTRNMGSLLINDPLLSRINMEMVNNRDIRWDQFWPALTARFQAKQTKDMFSSYIPPNRYIGVKFIRKVFNY